MLVYFIFSSCVFYLIMNQLLFCNATVAASPPMAPAPYLYMAGDNSICDVADAANDNCRIIQVCKFTAFLF